MNVVDTLSQGIANKDWALVEDALSLLSGSTTPKIPQPRVASSGKTAGKRKSKSPAQKVVRTGPATRKIVSASRVNLFEQMKEFEDVLPGSDRINDNVPRTPRKRAPYKPKKLKCQVCDKMVEVHPTLARENFTCDRCISKRK